MPDRSGVRLGRQGVIERTTMTLDHALRFPGRISRKLTRCRTSPPPRPERASSDRPIPRSPENGTPRRAVRVSRLLPAVWTPKRVKRSAEARYLSRCWRSGEGGPRGTWTRLEYLGNLILLIGGRATTTPRKHHHGARSWRCTDGAGPAARDNPALIPHGVETIRWPRPVGIHALSPGPHRR